MKRWEMTVLPSVPSGFASRTIILSSHPLLSQDGGGSDYLMHHLLVVYCRLDHL